MGEQVGYRVSYVDVQGKKRAEYVSELKEFGERNASVLASVELPEGVMGIPDGAFRECPHLTSVTLPSTLREIGNGAFAGCDVLRYVQVAGAVEGRSRLERIGDHAFRDCKGLMGIEMPSGVRTIGDRAFEGCRKLSGNVIPMFVEHIGTCAFRYDRGVSDTGVPGGADVCFGAFDFTDGKDTVLTLERFDGAIRRVDVAEQDLADVLDSESCDDVDYITFPDGMTYVDPGTCRGWDKLRGVSLPSSLQYVGGGAFSRCERLGKLTFDGTHPPEVPLGTIYDNCGYETVDSHHLRQDVPGGLYPFEGTPVEGLVEGAHVRALLRDRDAGSLGRELARSMAYEEGPSCVNPKIVPYPEVFGRYDVAKLLNGCVNDGDFDAVDRVLEAARDEAGRVRFGDKVPRSNLLDRLSDAQTLSRAGRLDMKVPGLRFKPNGREADVQKMRGASLFRDARDRSVVPGPDRWLFDMDRRIRFSRSVLSGASGVGYAHLYAGASQSAVSPRAGTLFTRARTPIDIDMQDIRTKLDVLLHERTARECGAEPAAVLALDGPDGFRRTGAFYTFDAMRMYLAECVFKDSDLGAYKLSCVSGRPDARKEFESALGAASGQSLRNLDWEEMDRVSHAAGPKSPKQWVSETLEGAETGSGPWNTAADESRVARSGAEPLATVRFGMPDGSKTEAWPLYTRDALHAYLAGMVCPGASDAGMHVKLTDPTDMDLAYDVYSTVKGAQGVKPEPRTKYEARCAKMRAGKTAGKSAAEQLSAQKARCQGLNVPSGGRVGPDNEYGG